jgi:hypothetical protein
MKRILLAFVILLGFQAGAFSQALPSGSLWQSQRGSTLEVFSTDHPEVFNGTFTDQAADSPCKGIPYGAQVLARNTSIIFGVYFLQCMSQTDWFGTVAGNTMRTNWRTVYFPLRGPPRRKSGSDVFTRIR